MAECTGWLLDIYPHPQGGLALWLVEKGGAPRLLRQPFPVTFYAAGPGDRLRLLWRFLQSQPVPVSLSRLERRDLFQSELLTVLSVQTPGPLEQETLFQQAAGKFPDLTYYDADISAPLRHAAQYGTFPLARLRVTLDERESPSQGQTIQAIQLLALGATRQRAG